MPRTCIPLNKTVINERKTKEITITFLVFVDPMWLFSSERTYTFGSLKVKGLARKAKNKCGGLLLLLFWSYSSSYSTQIMKMMLLAKIYASMDEQNKNEM